MAKNDYGGLILLAGLAGIGYLLYKSGVFGQQTELPGGGNIPTTFELPGTGQTLPDVVAPPNQANYTYGGIPVSDIPYAEPTPITIGLTQKPVIGATQKYTFAAPTKTGFKQQTTTLTTTPLMVTNPALVQARAMIQAGTGIDIGKMVSNDVYLSKSHLDRLKARHSLLPVGKIKRTAKATSPSKFVTKKAISIIPSKYIGTKTPLGRFFAKRL